MSRNLIGAVGGQAVDHQAAGVGAQPGELSLGELTRGGNPGVSERLHWAGLVEPGPDLAITDATQGGQLRMKGGAFAQLNVGPRQRKHPAARALRARAPRRADPAEIIDERVRSSKPGDGGASAANSAKGQSLLEEREYYVHYIECA